VKPSLTRYACLALATSTLVLALPIAQSEARSYKKYSRHTQQAITFALPFSSEAAGYTVRRHRYVKRYAAYRKWNRSGRHYVARRARTSVAAAPAVFPFFAAATGQQPAYASRNAHSSARTVARAQRTAAYSTRRSRSPEAPAPMSFGGSGLVSEARRYIGTNPTGRSALWCATFMNMVLERSGHRGTGSNLARSFASYGTRVSGPQVGAIAVMSRGRRGGHVGIVSGIDARGNPIIISGNYQRRVAEHSYSRGRIYAYVMPM
jgi:uncharacterized protein (TIGR02594 family)